MQNYAYICIPNDRRWVRITVSTRDSQSRNRSSILLPTTRRPEFFRPSLYLSPGEAWSRSAPVKTQRQDVAIAADLQLVAPKFSPYALNLSICQPLLSLSPTEKVVTWTFWVLVSKRRPQPLHLYRCMRPLRPFQTTFADPQKKHFLGRGGHFCYPPALSG